MSAAIRSETEMVIERLRQNLADPKLAKLPWGYGQNRIDGRIFPEDHIWSIDGKTFARNAVNSLPLLLEEIDHLRQDLADAEEIAGAWRETALCEVDYCRVAGDCYAKAVGMPEFCQKTERTDYLSDTQARELFGIEDDEALPDGRVRVCEGEWVRIPGGYYFDKTAGPLHPETAEDDEACDDCAVSIARPVEEPGEVERLTRELEEARKNFAFWEERENIALKRARDAEAALAEAQERLEKDHEIERRHWQAKVDALNAECEDTLLRAETAEAALAESEQNAQGLASDLAGTQAELAEARAVLDYITQTERNNDGYRIVDMCFAAFMAAKKPNAEDGGPSDWMEDTRPLVLEGLADIRARALLRGDAS